jgi:2-oxoglutarate dehydrogenase E1 component
MPSPLLRNPDSAQVAELYERYRSEPGGVAPDWQEFFRSLDAGAQGLLAALARGEDPSLAAQRASPAVRPPAAGDARSAALDSIRALALINAYRTRGHLEAKLDPFSTPRTMASTRRISTVRSS